MSWLITATQLATVATLILASRFLKYGGMLIFFLTVFLSALLCLALATGASFKNEGDNILFVKNFLVFLGASLITSGIGELLILVNERLATHLRNKLKMDEGNA